MVVKDRVILHKAQKICMEATPRLHSVADDAQNSSFKNTFFKDIQIMDPTLSYTHIQFNVHG